MKRARRQPKHVAHIALAVAMAAALPLRADLPGLPRAQNAGDTQADTHPAEVQHAAVAQAAGGGGVVGPPRGSLFRQGTAAAVAASYGPAGVENHAPPLSYFSVQAPAPRRYKKNDLLTVIIREDSDATTNGKNNAKKTQDYDLALEEFLNLVVASSGIPYATKVNNPSNLPEIKFKYSNNRQSDATNERQDSFSARISATVVDVKPNGTMVIEAVKQIVIDKEEQTFKLTGNCRVEDIAVDNSILSTQVANLSLSKQTKGNVHDGIKRGWLNRLMDQFTPF